MPVKTSGLNEPSMRSESAATLTLPALPTPEVLEEISPLATMLSVCACTRTFPPFPLPLPKRLRKASAEMPVKRSGLPAPSMRSESAVTLTLPALPTPKVLEAICPPPKILRSRACTETLPPSPLPGLEKEPASAEMPVKRNRVAAPSITSESAVTLTLPALPTPKVLEEIDPLPKILISRACTETLPPSPLPGLSKEPASAKMPVNDSGVADPSIRSDSAITLTLPAAPVPKVFEEISPPATILRSCACTKTLPPFPLLPSAAPEKMPVPKNKKGLVLVPSIKSKSVITLTLPASPTPEVFDEIFPALVILMPSLTAMSIVPPSPEPVVPERIWPLSKVKLPPRMTTEPAAGPLGSISAKLVRLMSPSAVNCVTATALLMLVASRATSPGDFTLTRFTRDPAPVIALAFIAISPATTENDLLGATFSPGPGIIFPLESIVLLPVIETAAGV